MANAFKSFARRFDLFVRYIEPRYPRLSAFGYLRGRITIDNAVENCGAPLILHVDITNFFPSISSIHVREVFDKLGLNEGVSDLLTNFVTINDPLPLGLHPSPMVANIVCLNLGGKFTYLSLKNGLKYTKYADDITISEISNLPEKIII